MKPDIDTKVTPALHPENVTQIEGYDEETAVYLAPTVTAFSEAYDGIRATWAAREAAAKNPTLNEAAQIIETDSYAQKQFARIARGFDSVRGTLEKSIGALEQQLSAPLESKAAHPVASEIRAHVKNLSTEKRHIFIKSAVDSGDALTVSSVLGAPAYLSGLDQEFQPIYTRLWNERQSPEVTKRLKVMIGAKELIEKRAGLVFKELEKAVGAPPHKARALREAKTNSEKAFVLQGA